MVEESSALAGLSEWIAGTLTGNVGIIVAVLAIATVGVEMLQGRLSIRDGARAALGCFILFGAPSIAQGLANLGDASLPNSAEVHSAQSPAPIAIPEPPQPNRDPYAGASVPI